MVETSKDRLIKILRDKKMSQLQLSKVLEMTYEYLNTIVNKEKIFTEKHARLFASALGCNADYLTLHSDIPYINTDMSLYGDALTLVRNYLINSGYEINATIDLYSGRGNSDNIFNVSKDGITYQIDPHDLIDLLKQITINAKAHTDYTLKTATQITK